MIGATYTTRFYAVKKFKLQFVAPLVTLHVAALPTGDRASTSAVASPSREFS
jgi:hypothetical protein